MFTKRVLDDENSCLFVTHLSESLPPEPLQPLQPLQPLTNPSSLEAMFRERDYSQGADRRM
ncbi:hypothetical protein Q8A73_009080 [Channa argus]|nr:hypothetical protein Q8A73_009080 [Channa argus]